MKNIDRLNEIEIENKIWIIYIGIIILSWYANEKEKKFIIFNDEKSKEQYRQLMIFIFSILVIIYYYYTKDSYSKFVNLDDFDDKKKILHFISFIGSTLVLISGILFLIILIIDENVDVEVAFN